MKTTLTIFTTLFMSALYGMEEKQTFNPTHRRTHSISSFSEFERAQLQQLSTKTSTSNQPPTNIVDLHLTLKNRILPELTKLEENQNKIDQQIKDIILDINNLKTDVVKLSAPKDSINWTGLCCTALASSYMTFLIYTKWYLH